MPRQGVSYYDLLNLSYCTPAMTQPRLSCAHAHQAEQVTNGDAPTREHGSRASPLMGLGGQPERTRNRCAPHRTLSQRPRCDSAVLDLGTPARRSPRRTSSVDGVTSNTRTAERTRLLLPSYACACFLRRYIDLSPILVESPGAPESGTFGDAKIGRTSI